jgi:hypothetical protein
MQLAAMQAPHDGIGEDFDRHHQHEADGFGLDGQRAADQAYRHKEREHPEVGEEREA